MSVEQQRPLIVAMLQHLPYRNAIAAIVQEKPHRRLFTPEGLVAVFRIAMAESSAGDGTDDGLADAFVRASLIIRTNREQITPEIVLNGPADLLPTELRSAIVSLENPHDLFRRTNAFLEWGLTGRAQAPTNY